MKMDKRILNRVKSKDFANTVKRARELEKSNQRSKQVLDMADKLASLRTHHETCMELLEEDERG